MTLSPAPLPCPREPERALPLTVRIVILQWTPDDLDVSPDEIREVEPVLIVVVTPAKGIR